MFYIILILLSLTLNCNSLQFKIPIDLCSDSNNFSGITVNDRHNNTIPEIMFVTNEKVYYSANVDTTDNRNWTIGPVVPSYLNRLVTFRRNFAKDMSECGQRIPLNFFIISYNWSLGSNVYNIFDPLDSNKWVEDKWPLLKDHYIFDKSTIDFTKPLDGVFVLNNFIVLIQPYNQTLIQMHTIVLNDTICMTVETTHVNPVSEAMKLMNSFYFKDLYIIGRENSEYFYQQLIDPKINESGQLVSVNSTEKVKLFGNLFICESITERPTTGMASSKSTTESIDSCTSVTTEESKTTTTSGNNTDIFSPSTSSMPNKDWVLRLIFFIVITIIIVIIICIVCYLISRFKTETITPIEEQKVEEIKEMKETKEKTKTDEEKSWNEIPEIMVTQKKTTEKFEAKPPTTHNFIPINDTKQVKQNETKPKTIPSLKSLGNLSLKESLSEVIPPDEAKPDNPFAGFP